MTEQQWLASDDPNAMLRNLTAAVGVFGKTSDRKLRLFACAAGWLALSRMTCPPVSEQWREHFAGAVAAGEGWADGGFANWANARNVACLSDTGEKAACETVRVADLLESAELASIFRDIIGNPFRPVTLPRSVGCLACGGTGSFLLGSGEDAERIECRCCPWLTPDAVALAHAAYDERGRKCRRCGGAGQVRNFIARGTGDNATEYWMEDCPDCRGTGRIDDGTLDPVRLSILADALEEAGCCGELCDKCKGSGTYTVQTRNAGLSAANGYGAATTYSEWRGCRWCGGDYDRKGSGRLPHHIIAHLRSPGPHYRGCWAVDVLRPTQTGRTAPRP